MGPRLTRRAIEYTEAAISTPARADDVLRGQANPAGEKLDAIGTALAAIAPADRYHELLLVDARAQYRKIVEARWVIVEQSEGTIPMELVAMLIAWLTLIFGSFGFRAPRNAVVLTTFVVAVGLIAASIYLVLDMDEPFSGPIQVSDATLHRALAEMQM